MKLNTHTIKNNFFRIIILSDTHSYLNPLIYNLINKDDYVIHAGDILDHEILTNIKLMSKKLYAVNGNNDDYTELNDVEIITTSIGNIVVTHGHKHYPDYHDSLRRAYPEALIIVYGHTHHHTLDMTKKPYIVNPGAAGKTRTQGGASCIILSNSSNGFNLELKKFNLNQ
ncbi:MAG: YfcE family phosphodiesterase [Gammaproteobacteria bacterium]|jgi:putative phosphoesterase|nr:YfcE family phosphodiesterase [Gammaproteobacteria bacterium]MBT6733896.1 YfcE family phosphodiesterase [Gammaproteobacteria bacterium]MBT7236011.1 YfcE family phosphodiesterase [Gammaproteobacteria bacterium]MBV04078.1 YfcE family phosphodiesterase [Paracoccaceae bacterium]|tara:strand:- start:10178 stop:10687 length:510 start_codon:yes stop_codon:yes gene_type:complete